MLMQIGPLQFDVAPFNAHEIEHEAASDFAKKEVVARRKIYEAVGEGDETLTIRGKLFPFKLGGLGALEVAHALRRKAAAQWVVRGDGHVLGWYVITKISDKHNYLAAGGVGQEIEVTTTLERADSPGALGAFMSLFGLLG